MGFYGFIRGVHRKRVRIGQTISRNAIRSGGFVAGVYTGAKAIKGVRRDLKGFAARELADEEIVSRSIGIIHRTSKHLAAFDEKKLAKLFKKISTDPEEFNRIIEKDIHLFREDLIKFTTAYTDFLQAVNDMLVGEAQEHTFQDRTLRQVLLAYTKKAREDGVVVPKDLLEEVKKEFAKVFRTGLRETRYALRDDRRTRASLLSPGGTYLAHKIKKLISKYRRDEMVDIKQNLEEMKRQLAEGLKPDFLLRLNRHLKSLQKIERYFRELHHDIRLIMLSVDEEVKDAYAAIARFLAVFRNVESVKESNLEDLLARVREEHKEMQKLLDSDYVNVKRLNKQIAALKTQVNISFPQLANAAERVLKKIEENPREYIWKEHVSA